MSIQRWGLSKSWIGEYVTFQDHLAAYEDVKERAYRHGVEQSKEACIAAVEALGQQHPKWNATSTHYEDCWKQHSECALTYAIDILREVKP